MSGAAVVTFGSVCAGIGGLDKGLEDAGLECLWQIEIDQACQGVLRHRFKKTIYDDATFEGKHTIQDRVRVLAGGTPCQGFSISGLRQGLGDDRSNLCLHFCRIADELGPDLVLWENVPGALSLEDNSFGCFLGALVGHDAPLVHPAGAGLSEWQREGAGGSYPVWPGAGMVAGPKRTACWRILDSQYFGLAQRRRRLFVIADAFEQAGRVGIEELRERIGFHGVAAAILFEPEMLRRHTAPSRAAGESAAGTLGGGPPGSGPRSDYERMTFVPEVSYPVMAGAGGSKFGSGREAQDTFIAFEKGRGEFTGDDLAGTLRTNQGEAEGVNGGKADNQCVAFMPGNLSRGAGCDPAEEISPPLREEADGDLKQCVAAPLTGNPHADNASRESLLVVGFRGAGQDGFTPSEVSPPIAATDGGGSGTPAVAIRTAGNCGPFVQGDKTAALNTNTDPAQNIVLNGMCVRRLTPVECERLQGLADDWTREKELPDGKVRRQKDSPRYRQIGNAVSRNVAEWLGKRIVKVLKVIDGEGGR